VFGITEKKSNVNTIHKNAMEYARWGHFKSDRITSAKVLRKSADDDKTARENINTPNNALNIMERMYARPETNFSPRMISAM
jgi:hypothetical protein